MSPLTPAQAGRFAALAAPVNAALAAAGEAPVTEALLVERAAMLGLAAPGRSSANGACRLLRAGRGWLALNLARPEDAELVPALIESEVEGDAWAAVARSGRSACELAARGRLLGLPLSRPGEAARLPAATMRRFGGRRRPEPSTPLVVDLSSLWAGPLAGHLLARLGFRVIRVESRHRPDGAGAARPFFRRLAEGKEVAEFDLRTRRGLAGLLALLARADVVIEASRPRALRQFGIVAEQLAAERPGMIWMRITAYGPRQPDRVGFGDDAAVAGGLVARDGEGKPIFVGDAIADPLAGLVAARAVLAARRLGGGTMIEVSLAGAAAAIARTP